MFTMKVFEEANRLYVEIENPPADLKEKLSALVSDAVVKSLEGLVPQEEKKPIVSAPKAEAKPVDDDWADDMLKAEAPKAETKPTDDEWETVTADECPFEEEAKAEESIETVEPEAKPAKSTPRRTVEDIANDDDWA